MQKIGCFTVLFTILCLSSGVFAQNIRVGIKGGLNINRISGDNAKGDKNKYGLNLGAFFDLEASSDYHIQPEIFFSTQGETYEINGQKAGFNLGYINVPIMFQYYANDNIYLGAGPQFGFLMYANEYNEANGVKVSKDVKDDLNLIDFALAFGGGVQLENGLGFDLRYTLGVSHLDRKEDQERKNAVLSIGLRYLF